MLCFHCMKQLNTTAAAFCPYCGKPTAEKNPPHQLAAGTVLDNRYIVGNALGEGGFGITYIGFDKTLEVKIAIKEYYPSGLVNRIHTYSNSVTVSQSSDSDTYEHGLKNFLNEAKNVARFIEEAGIVDVRDFFTENNTAYIVMEYIDGITLMNCTHDRGIFEFGNLIDLMLPLMRSLEKMHAQNIIHRDISPDNIMITKSGGLKLLDFGAARYFSDDGIKTMSVILKKGYAPYEQYSKKSKQGPWTDVYALCATIYKCITGITPPDSLDRIVSDELKAPSELGVSIKSGQEKALMRGMATLPRDRIQNIGELIDALNIENTKAKPKPVITKKPKYTELTVKADPAETEETVAADYVNPEMTTAKIFKVFNWKQTSGNSKKPVAEDLQIDDRKQASEEEQSVNIQITTVKSDNSTIAADEEFRIAGRNPSPEYTKKRSKKALIIGGIALVLVAAIVMGCIFKLKPYIEDRKLSAQFKESESISLRDSLAQTISAGEAYTVGLKSDGTVVATGNNYNKSGQREMKYWKNIVAISVGENHSVGLKSNGTIVTTPILNREYDYGQCDVSDWNYIIVVSAGIYHTVGLKSDGTVVATGYNDDGQCDVGDWEDIVSISTGFRHTVGLKSDGTVVAAGNNNYYQCDVSGWKDIIAVCAGGEYTVGLKSDGTVVATGRNNYGQSEVSDWEDIIAVSANAFHTVGLKSDGTVVATTIRLKNIDCGQCDVSDWKDIVAISAGLQHTVGLKSDGTVVATGLNNDGQCDVSDWKDIKLPASN